MHASAGKTVVELPPGCARQVTCSLTQGQVNKVTVSVICSHIQRDVYHVTGMLRACCCGQNRALEYVGFKDSIVVFASFYESRRDACSSGLRRLLNGWMNLTGRSPRFHGQLPRPPSAAAAGDRPSHGNAGPSALAHTTQERPATAREHSTSERRRRRR